ncbi:MAG: SDR family NAD(P)-dependent oxidoreductase [Oscillospiraceae bacterium]|nr:SDR family NAD(P)-dependent oxidoreductase [Oscillospiraceae bacterium]
MKVNVVTGGGSGIGKAVAAMLPKDGPVIIAGRTPQKLERTALELNAEGCRILTAVCDVSKREDVRALALYASSLGDVDRVIHCAGVSGSMADRETIIRINALGTLHVNQEFFKVMRGGCIVDIASDSGYMLPRILLLRRSAYRLALADEDAFAAKAARKARLVGKDRIDCQIAYMISKDFARRYSERCAFKYMALKGIRVFSVSPGFVKTPMTELEKSKESENMLSYTGHRRGADPEELAYVITALADERARYLIGSDILCDGGAVNNGFGALTARKRCKERSLTENW